jgi:type II secretory pathway pseudopilin PulG
MPDAGRGIKLADIVVLVLILGVLGVVLAPALLKSRTGGRRGDCMNNQHQACLAILEYERAHGRLPGYLETLAGRNVSWVAATLREMERADLYREFAKGRDAPSYLPSLVCPSAAPPPKSSLAFLSYAVNCGMAGDSDTPDTAVFFNHGLSSPAGAPRQTIAYIQAHDGCGYTIMLTENTGERLWTATSEVELGVVYDCPVGINQRLGEPHLPRPSSFHPGGVVVAFCDRRVDFLSEDIDAEVYRQMMRPNDARGGR